MRPSLLACLIALAFASLCGACGSPGTGGGTDGGAEVDGGDTTGCAKACGEGARTCDGDGFKVCELGAGGCLGWSAVTSCAANEICDTGACRKNCLDHCSPGTALCEGGGLRSCEQRPGGCHDWGTLTACGLGQVCSGGTCATSCSNQCTEGAKQCTLSGTVSCQKLSTGCTEWVAPTPCAAGEVCSGGQCVPDGTCVDQCVASSSRCTATSQQQDCVTQSSGCTEWALPKACAEGQSCVAPATTCAVVSCSAGQTRCAGTTIESCTAQGSWIATSTCPQACQEGVCTATVSCSAGAVRCNADAVEVCNSSGTAWLHSQSCTATCSGGVCTGPCQAGEKRCLGSVPETCNAQGTGWTAGNSCAVACFAGDCIVADLLVDGVTVTMEGSHRFQNSVVVRNGGKIQVGLSGELQLIAPVISVDSASHISANNVSNTTGYVSALVSNTDLSAATGHRYSTTARGGGLIDLRGSTITIDGQVTANAGGLYAGGGTVMLAADQLLGTGALQAASTSTTTQHWGKIKLLHGSARTLNASSGFNQVITSLMPPLSIASATHPEPSRVYNNGADTLELAWERSFPAVNGYYQRFSTGAADVLTPANATFIQAESLSLPLAGLSGTRYFHLISVDGSANLGTVRNVFPVRINATAPTIASSSHPTQTTWYANDAAFLSWSGGLPPEDTTGFYYLLDQYGDTVPTAANGVFTTNSQVLLSNLPPGIWMFHLVSRDTQGRTTRNGRHFRLNIGAALPMGNLSGSVFDGSNNNAPLANVSIRINRGLFNATSITGGTYTFNNAVSEGNWEVTAIRAGYVPQTRMVTITGGNVTNENFVLQPAP